MLTAMSDQGGSTRFVVLVSKLGVSRDSLRTTLVALTELGLIQKNPGYGHPLRPEYVLTPRGRKVAAAAATYLKNFSQHGVLLRKWSAPVLHALAGGCTRFNEVQSTLGISPRALTQALRLLTENRLVLRLLEDSYPPTTSYLVNPECSPVTDVINTIAVAMDN